MPPIENKKSLRDEIKFNEELFDNAETSYDGKLNFNEIITKLSNERADDNMIGLLFLLLLLIYLIVKLYQKVKYMIYLIPFLLNLKNMMK